VVDDCASEVALPLEKIASGDARFVLAIAEGLTAAGGVSQIFLANFDFKPEWVGTPADCAYLARAVPIRRETECPEVAPAKRGKAVRDAVHRSASDPHWLLPAPTTRAVSQPRLVVCLRVALLVVVAAPTAHRMRRRIVSKQCLQQRSNSPHVHPLGRSPFTRQFVP